MMGDVSRAQTAKRRAENEIEFSRIVAFSDGVFAIAITLAGPEPGRNALIVGSVFLVSIPVALVEPHAAPYYWLALFFVPLVERITRWGGPGREPPAGCQPRLAMKEIEPPAAAQLTARPRSVAVPRQR